MPRFKKKKEKCFKSHNQILKKKNFKYIYNIYPLILKKKTPLYIFFPLSQKNTIHYKLVLINLKKKRSIIFLLLHEHQ